MVNKILYCNGAGILARKKRDLHQLIIKRIQRRRIGSRYELGI